MAAQRTVTIGAILNAIFARALPTFRQKLHDRGRDPAELNTIETLHAQIGEDPMDEPLVLAKGTTAVMRGKDVLGALRRAQEIGPRMPQDISITRYDDIALARIVRPSLTTVHVPHRDMGREAATKVQDVVEKISTGNSIESQTALKLRESLEPSRSSSCLPISL